MPQCKGGNGDEGGGPRPWGALSSAPGVKGASPLGSVFGAEGRSALGEGSVYVSALGEL